MQRRLFLLLLTTLIFSNLGADKEKSAHVFVSIHQMAFDPASVNISAGDSVSWMNNDDRDHSVVAADGSFDSGNLSSGKKFTQAFKQAGKFAYSCSYHPRMKGVVNVAEK